MKRSSSLFLLIISFVSSLTFCQSAKALSTVSGMTIAVFAQARSNNDVNFVQFSGTVTGCTFNRAYIAYEDKEVFAAALTAGSQLITVGALVDTGAATKTMDTHGPNPIGCRIISLWLVP